MTHEKETKHQTAGVPATYLSLCSGYDGIGIALSRIFPNLRTLAHVEIESFGIANMVAKMEEGKLDSCPVFTDVKRFPFEDLRGRVGILSAGFPCQPFSSAGKRQATEDPRHIYPYIADGISACRPSYVFLENVEGIISSKTGDGESVLLYVLRDLEERGYKCTWGTFSAAEVIGGDGRRIPHLRKRVFILAELADGDVEGLEGHGGGVVESEASEREGEGDEWSVAAGGLQHSIYPARPNEPQNWWEEPRVVGNASSKRLEGSGGKSVQGGDVGLTCADGEEDAELGDAADDGRRPHQPNTQADGVVGESEEGRVSESEGGRAELADSRHAELSGRDEASEGCVQEPLGESSSQDSGDGELADSKSGKPRKSQGGDGRKDTGGGSEEELEDSESGEPKFDSMQGRQEGTERGKHSISVGLSSGSGSEEVGQLGDASSERSRGGSADSADVESEVPRKGSESIVADAEHSQRGTYEGLSHGDERREGSSRDAEGCLQADVSETEPELGGTTDAWGGLRGVDPIANRVDRLRLLGNGVCPDTGELAFRALYNKLNGGNNV